MQREPAGDQELNLKKRARRRLVGAIALVLLMIIVLPMILKDRAAIAPAEKITITLPSDQAPVAPSDFDSTIVPAESASAVIDETKPEALQEVPVEVPAEVPSETNTNTDNDAEAAAPAKETSVKETPAKTAAGQKFYVQVGVFSDAANVKQLQSKLSDLGYKSQTEKISTDKGQKIRLRTQTFGDRNEAAIALENIKDAGLSGMVVSQ
jgi:DedD protein